MEKEVQEPSYIIIEPKGEMIEIEWRYTVFSKNQAGKLSCYIPSFNIFFSASDKTMMDKKAQALTKMYLDHFMLHSKGKTGLKALAIQLHKLGFKAKDGALSLKRILKDDTVSKTKFNANLSNNPEGYIESESVHHQSEFAIA